MQASAAAIAAGISGDRGLNRGFSIRQRNISFTALKRLKDRSVRIRGWIERRNGPLITVWRPEQVELLRRTSTGDVVRFNPPRLLMGTRTAQ